MAGNKKPKVPNKSWGKNQRALPGYAMESLYQVKNNLGKQTRERVGLTMKIPVYIQDPLVARQNPTLGVQEIDVRLEVGLGDGPTNARLAVVDYNAETESLSLPVVWDENVGWFQIPASSQETYGVWLPDAPHITPKMPQNKKDGIYTQFIEATIQNPFYHQMNAWAIVQRVLEFYEAPQALGRPVPWGFDGHRLLIVPHAGYGENAFYDRKSKSLQFYYYGDTDTPGFTCLSHDIITHESGHAILDGLRPLYNELSSVQTAAFHEFIGDLTALMLSLFNNDIRHYLAKTTAGDLSKAGLLANLAEEFGRQVEGRPYLRTAFNDLKMSAVKDSLSPHYISQVMTGAMYQILERIAAKHLEKGQGEEDESNDKRVTPAKALWWAADRFRRVALQPLDLCPPCDIQFIDYAKAVVRNDILTNPVDSQGYRQAMLDIFHQRELCTCAYQSGQDLPEDCLFLEAMQLDRMDFVYHDIETIASSPTAAYYFLDDNRKQLLIPPHQDLVVADLYGNEKYGVAAKRLPREVVLVYTWIEQVKLESDDTLDFGRYEGQMFDLICGGTLVFDGRNNLLSWMRKPGTEHLTPEAEGEILAKARQTKWDQMALKDLEEGRKRKKDLLSYISGLVNNSLVGSVSGNRFADGMQPILAIQENGSLHLETQPHLRESEFEKEAGAWSLNF